MNLDNVSCAFKHSVAGELYFNMDLKKFVAGLDSATVFHNKQQRIVALKELELAYPKFKERRHLMIVCYFTNI